MIADRPGFVWLASYPKSGNTFLRLLLDAYHRNGLVDINSTRTCTGDSNAGFIQAVSPLAVDAMDLRSEALLRPAAILNAYAKTGEKQPFMKTHWANLKPGDLPPYIPKDFTSGAVYVVRDPRDVLNSMCNWYGYSQEACFDIMGQQEMTLGGIDKNFARAHVSGWSNHVRSWVGEKEFPVHFVRYEDLTANAEKELKEVLEFVGWEIDEDRIHRAVEATRICKLQAQEKEKGFKENLKSKADTFFGGGGGSKWRELVAPKWARAIEERDGEMMKMFQYLHTDNVESIRA